MSLAALGLTNQHFKDARIRWHSMQAYTLPTWICSFAGVDGSANAAWVRWRGIALLCDGELPTNKRLRHHFFALEFRVWMRRFCRVRGPFSLAKSAVRTYSDLEVNSLL